METTRLDAAEAARRLKLVADGVGEALDRCGRGQGEVRILAVSKTHPPEMILPFISAGQTAFGESYAQEAALKIPLLPSGLEWHFIGHLQTNKARKAVGLFQYLHSLESLELAAELDKRLAASGSAMGVYVQVNVSGEPSKEGLEPAALPGFLDSLVKYDRLVLRGLMTIPPYDPDPETSRPYFAKLRELRDKYCPDVPGLSMGMTDDHLVAVAEGSTVVRVGTAFFGPRKYS